MPRRYTIVRIVLGVLLLAAAGLKLNSLSVSAVPRVGWFAQPWVQLAAVEWEAVLGLWLLIGAQPRGSWFAAVGTFVAFAGVSAYLGWVGVASCGCFGTIQATPWLAFGVDLSVVAGLSIAVPKPAVGNGPARPVLPRLVPAAVALGVCSAPIALGLIAPTFAATTLASLRGETLIAVPSVIDLGECTRDQELRVEVQVRNMSTRSIRLVGGTADCSCDVTPDLPAVLQPGEDRSIQIRFRVKQPGPGVFTRTVRIGTDDAEEPYLNLMVRGRIR